MMCDKLLRGVRTLVVADENDEMMMLKISEDLAVMGRWKGDLSQHVEELNLTAQQVVDQTKVQHPVLCQA